jgi:beta-lactam-binding protein with PASTA domain
VRSVYVFLNWTGEAASPCVVAPLRGRPFGRARRVLRRSGCRPDAIHGRRSRAIRKRRVIAQSPSYGRVLPSRSPIDIVVSRGPGR